MSDQLDDNKGDDFLSNLSFLDSDDKSDDKEDDKVDDKKDDDKDDKSLKLEDEEVDDEDDDEEDDDEEDDKEEDEEERKLELDDDEIEVNIPNRQKIIKEFPELFKKFPSLERAFYREQQFTEVFPTPAEAKIAANKAATLSTIEQELASGNIDNLLTSVKKFDDKAFNKITDNFLGTLQKLNPEAHVKTVNHITKSVLAAANKLASQATKTEDSSSFEEQIGIAARILHKWIYNTDKIEDIPTTAAKPNEEDPRFKELEDKQNKLAQQQFERASNEINDRIVNMIKANVSRKIDPQGRMSDYVKNKAVEDVLNGFYKEVKSDTRFQALLNRLWKEAATSDFSEESKAKIKNNIKKQAEVLLPDIMRRVRVGALKGSSANKNTERRSERPLERRQPATKEKTSSSERSEKKSKIPDNMSDLDFLNAD